MVNDTEREGRHDIKAVSQPHLLPHTHSLFHTPKQMLVTLFPHPATAESLSHKTLDQNCTAASNPNAWPLGPFPAIICNMGILILAYLAGLC